jgi:bis(5'-adenosyl)-triphosphatase
MREKKFCVQKDVIFASDCSNILGISASPNLTQMNDVCLKYLMKLSFNLARRLSTMN